MKYLPVALLLTLAGRSGLPPAATLRFASGGRVEVSFLVGEATDRRHGPTEPGASLLK